MIKKIVNLIAISSFISVLSCTPPCTPPPSGTHKVGPPREERYPASSTAKVKVVWENGKFTLYRDNVPYYIKGATTWHVNVPEIPARGGNSMRTYEAYQLELDEAEAAGITITLGLDTRGIDYDDPVQVAEQLIALRETVRTYRDHPNLLCWGIGNEMECRYPGNNRIWDAVNDIAWMIHQEDPDHPTMTVISGPTEELIYQVATRAPEIDILGINAYGSMPDVARIVRNSVWNGPYIFCEWGPNGWWDDQTDKAYFPVDSTYLMVPIEPPGAAKVDIHLQHFSDILADKELCLGSYVFLWYQKHECSPTWYTNFLREDPILGFNGESTETADAVQYVWTGAWPANRAPLVNAIAMNDLSATAGITVSAGAVCSGSVTAVDLESDTLEYVWEVIPTADIFNIGTITSRLPPLFYTITSVPEVSFTAPADPGLYRLCVYVADGQGHVGVANIPFCVE